MLKGEQSGLQTRIATTESVWDRATQARIAERRADWALINPKPPSGTVNIVVNCDIDVKPSIIWGK
jgi:hypothetical protein